MLVRAYSSQSCLCRWSRAAPADLSGPVWLTACSWITAGEDCPLGRIEPSVPLTFSVIFRQVRRTGGGRQWQMPSGVGARVDRPARKNKRGRIDKCQTLTPACTSGGLNGTGGWRRIDEAFKVWRRVVEGTVVFKGALRRFVEEIQITTILMRFLTQTH